MLLAHIGIGPHHEKLCDALIPAQGFIDGVDPAGPCIQEGRILYFIRLMMKGEMITGYQQGTQYGQYEDNGLSGKFHCLRSLLYRNKYNGSVQPRKHNFQHRSRIPDQKKHLKMV
jgi:hypothetical protein